MALFGIGSKKKLEALWAICQKHSRMLSVAKTDAARGKAMKKHFDLADKYAARLGNDGKKNIDKHLKVAKKYGYNS